MMTVCAKKGKRETDIFFLLFRFLNVHRITQQFVVNQECQTTILANRRIATTRVTTCTYGQ